MINRISGRGMKKFTKYWVALVPLALTALYAGLTITSEPQEMAGGRGVYNLIYDRWILLGLVITVIALFADAAGDIIRSTWHHRHH
jgi:hypothetical protein